MSKLQHCIILSTKSSGSSALQQFLVSNFGFEMTEKTPHHENETLYWAKAAAVLGLHQQKMHRSNIPYSRTEALEALSHFAKANQIGDIKAENATKAHIFELYYNLVAQHKPCFVEKSPHHLYNQSDLDLIREFIELYSDKIDFKIIGLVRHPLSMIYSGWDRWKNDCKQFEQEWFISNQNLLLNKDALQIEIVRYEDLVAENGAFIQKILSLDPVSKKFEFRSSSLEKWKSDKEFGHELSQETIQLANQFGYDDFETPGGKLPWMIKSLSTYVGVEIKRIVRRSA